MKPPYPKPKPLRRQPPDERVRAYWGWLKEQPCTACGRHGTHANPVEVAHVRGIWSDRLRDLTHRSHLGMQGWAALPLCRECHQEQHRISEERYLQTMVPLAHARITTLVLRWFLEEEENRG